ncbi:hypothetical protein M422DRAFT_48474 [Sphaerobolus stellatus SS14]|uniref:Thiolase N-terminal domain-containing protein n=1 Tax=Sphaerobolus stellatus (strain SS14) TaxID=990650 RepID=A0A0C9VT97_SPHS4|nr:hypothetical protein M422DRAFT_48474 [Sphaerobolus stellatus SS14]
MPSASENILECQDAADCLISMDITFENVAKHYKIFRDIHDAFAAKSFRKAVTAQKAGNSKSKIIPVKTKWTDLETDEEIIVDSDDGIHDGVTKESFAQLKPAFSKDGSTHAGQRLARLRWRGRRAPHTPSAAKRLGLPKP